MDNLSKYLEDISFIRWVFEPSSELDLFWNQFVKQYPKERSNIQLARTVVLQFRIATNSLSEEEKIVLFSRVLKQIEEKQQSRKQTRFIIGLAKYAAVAILFFSIGVLLFYQKKTVNPAFDAFKLNVQNADNQAKLIRANGENIILKDKRSIISYKKDGKLIIDQDTLAQTSAVFKNSIALNQLIIPYGKTSEILLPDGTKVILNAGSRLAYPDKFDGKTREVMLLGEAYFEVMHDSKHPFVVQVNNIRIKDLGTSFNVSAYPSDRNIKTVLVEGKVSIKQNNSGLLTLATELSPGQLASFDSQTNKINVKQVDVNDYILWIQGMMKFESVELNNIIKKLERFYNIRFQFDDLTLGEIRISGKLELIENTKEVVDRIARTAEVNIIDNGDGSYKILR